MSIASRIEQSKVLKLVSVLVLFLAAIAVPVGLYLLLILSENMMAIAILLAALTVISSLVSLTYIIFIPKYVVDILKEK